MSKSHPNPPAALRRIEDALRSFALTFPEAWEDFPWGHSAFKVKAKIFVTMGIGEHGISMSFKLPHSGREALLLPFTEPTHYGMGKHGWVTAKFGEADEPPMFLLRDWIEESYRAIATKTLVARLDARAEASAPARAKKATPRRKATAKKATAKKAAKNSAPRRAKTTRSAPAKSVARPGKKAQAAKKTATRQASGRPKKR